MEESTLSKQRKNISVYKKVETLNKHPSIFINYLRVLAGLKGDQVPDPSGPRGAKGAAEAEEDQEERED